MSLINIEKTIFVKDEYGVTSQAFVAGTSVEQYVYNAVLGRGKVLNPEDLPVEPGLVTLTSFNASPDVVEKPAVETKELPAAEEVAVEKHAKKKK